MGNVASKAREKLFFPHYHQGILRLGESDKEGNLDSPSSLQSAVASGTETLDSGVNKESPILDDNALRNFEDSPTAEIQLEDSIGANTPMECEHLADQIEESLPPSDATAAPRETPEDLKLSKKDRKKEKKHKSRKFRVKVGNPITTSDPSPVGTPDSKSFSMESTTNHHSPAPQSAVESDIIEQQEDPQDNTNSNHPLSTSPDIVSILATKSEGQKKKVGPSYSTPVDINGVIERLLSMRSERMSKNTKIKNSEIHSICCRAKEIFLQQPILLDLNPPVRIVGDIHGQYKDLLRFFDMCGYPPSANYLFLGDYVDRGKQSLETILLLLCYKIKYPENVFLLRGNHECASVNRVYGFYDECKRKCNLRVWRAFTDLFNCLPVAAIVGAKIFCVHGGLSPGLGTMNDILRIQRPLNVPDFGLLNDLLWSDPSDKAVTWEGNERGVSYCFSKQILTGFLTKHKFDLVCRAHMVVQDGYEFFHNRSLVTIFSAPNYCGEFDNRGAIMSVSEDLLCSFEILEPELNPRFAVQRFRKPLKRVVVTRRSAFP